MSRKHVGLGKGFDALIPENLDVSALTSKEERIRKLPVAKLAPNPHQPRRHFDEEFLIELSESIKRHGILQPLVVTPAQGDNFQIVAGERRWRAAQLAGLDTVPAVVRTTEELQQLEVALVENVQRVDLSPLEQAASIQRLHEQFSQEYSVIAKRLGKALSTVMNIVRLLKLSPRAQQALHSKEISEGHARAILALKTPELQENLLEQIRTHGWTVRQAERYVLAHKHGAKSEAVAKRRVLEKTPQTEKLSSLLKTPVTLRRTAKGGKLEITFQNDTDLRRIIQRLTKG